MLQKTIPSYELYGELLAGRYSDPVHHEPIHERSSKHDWTIRLHRHAALAQVFLFRSSGVFVRMGDLELTSDEPMILVVPPGIAHGFRFSENVVGDVLSLRVDEQPDGTLDRIEDLRVRGGGILSRGQAAHFDTVAALVAQLDQAYHGIGAERSGLLSGLSQLVVTYIAADLHLQRPLGYRTMPDPMTRHEEQAELFCRLLEANFDKDWSVEIYARQVGVSGPHLTRICRSVLGSPPNALVRQRRVLEAKRLLEYTRLSVSEVAHKAGFRDPAFFSRTFKKTIGCAPKAYRLDADGIRPSTE
ncbi:MAG: helix-turn-helix domain-containing protein [Pseudomonadota bacterium]